MVAAWRARCALGRDARVGKAASGAQGHRRLPLYLPAGKANATPHRKPTEINRFKRTFPILRFYWSRKAFSCVQQLGCLIKDAFSLPCSAFAHMRGYFLVLSRPSFSPVNNNNNNNNNNHNNNNNNHTTKQELCACQRRKAP